jgi:APA family basic amino acid/polyamine antiporter
VSDFLIAIPVGMVAFTGIDTISNMAEEARDSGRTVPQAMRLVVVAVMAISLTLPAVALSAMPVENGETLLALSSEEGGYANNPIQGVVVNLGLGDLQPAAEVYVGLLASTILLVATNAGLIGLSRLSYSMGQYRQLPEGLRRLHPRFRTPYVAIVVFGSIACLTMLPGEAEFLGTVYAFGAMLGFTMAHASVVALRIKEPDRERPYRAPLNVAVRGRSIPLASVLGGLGTGIAFLVVTILNFETLVTGTLWLALGMTVYVVYRRRLGLTLTETRKIVLPEPIVEREVEYESVLVVFDEGRYSSEAMSTAVQLAARRRRGIHVLVTVPVPPNLPIDAAMPVEEQRAGSVIDQARVRGGRRVSGHWEKVRPGGTGRRVVDEARAIKARAIVMSLPPRRTGTSLFGKSLETVLAERPCRVIITTSPGGPSKVAT